MPILTHAFHLEIKSLVSLAPSAPDWPMNFPIWPWVVWPVRFFWEL